MCSTYNTDGQRVKKTVSTLWDDSIYTYEYFYNGEILAGQKVSKTENGETTEYTLAFMYDNNGDAFGFLYNGEPYYYIKNAQNDVVLITNADGGSVVLYQYDAWGNVTQCFDGTEENIAAVNPILYRSYYYDAEMGMYYLNSRYYVPALCRFLNADSVVAGTGESVQGYNLFAYCFNNPVTMSDETGTWPKWVKNAASAIIKAAKKVVSVGTESANAIKSSFSLANHVQKTHVTTPTAMLNLGTMFGKVGFSATVTQQNKEPGLVHSALDIGNDASKYLVGINIVGWLGADVGVSSEINAFVSAQVTPWVHGEVSFGLDGIGAVIGFDVGDTSYDFEINGGWGLIAIFFVPQIVASSGQPSVVEAY